MRQVLESAATGRPAKTPAAELGISEGTVRVIRAAAVTFFNAAGDIVDTGSDSETNPVPGVRYPVNVVTLETAVRAEAVTSVLCT